MAEARDSVKYFWSTGTDFNWRGGGQCSRPATGTMRRSWNHGQ